MNQRLDICFLLLTAAIARAADAAEERLLELDQIIVTGALPEKASASAVPVTVLSDEALLLKAGHSIGETLKNEQGIMPRMPPLRYGLQRDYSKDELSSYLRVTRADDQPHAGDFETSTAGYVLLDIGADYQLKVYQAARLLVFAKANNLLDENIRNATSYLRNFAPEPGRGAQIGFKVSY